MEFFDEELFDEMRRGRRRKRKNRSKRKRGNFIPTLSRGDMPLFDKISIKQKARRLNSLCSSSVSRF
jgi:hypothetical protein